MTKKEKKIRLAEIVARLKEIYPAAECALEYGGDPWRLLVMARLSAQCTDARVNIVSKELFKKVPTAEAMAAGELAEIEEIIKHPEQIEIPWYGQLMTTPQTIAYFVQINYWLEKYKISIV